MTKPANLFADLPQANASEEILALVAAPHVRIERIVSRGHASPPDFWYDQDRAEWVLLLSGAAGLLLDGEAVPRALRPGDHVLIPPHRRHRVEWTDPQTPTIWLAVHFD